MSEQQMREAFVELIESDSALYDACRYRNTRELFERVWQAALRTITTSHDDGDLTVAYMAGAYDERKRLAISEAALREALPESMFTVNNVQTWNASEIIAALRKLGITTIP